jgi:hypothetical protein
MLTIVVIYICFFNNPINPELGSVQPTQPVITEEKIDKNFKEGISGKETLENIQLSLISYKVDKVENMNFDSKVPECEKATAMTLLLYSDNISIPLSQIEKTEIKTKGGTPIDAEIDTFVLNNKKASIVFVKIEDNKQLENLSLEITTYDGNTKIFSIPTEEKPSILKTFTTEIGDATNGDVIYISGIPYFILENGVFESYSYSCDNSLYSEAVVGTILVPMTNLFRETLAEDNFSVVYYSEDGKENDYGTSISYKLNNEEMVSKYKHKFSGLYSELLTCTYRIEMENKDDTVAIDHRDYMIDNTWYKINTEKNALLKLKGKNIIDFSTD